MKRLLGLFIFALLVLVSLNFVSTAVYIEAPGNGSLHTTNVLFNVSYVNGTDITDAANATFYYNLTGTWTAIGNTSNCDVAVGGTFGSCSLTMSIASLIDGNFSINATIANGSGIGTVGAGGLALNVFFDSTAPDVNNITLPLNSTTYSGIVVFNSTVRDLNTSIGGVFYNITNISGDQVVIVPATRAGGSAGVADYWDVSYNTAALDGVYNVTVHVNDTAGNVNKATVLKSVTFDNTGPSIALTRSATSGKNTVVITIDVSDVRSSITSTCTSDRSGASITGTGISQTLTENTLDCGTSYNYIITCTDSFSNSASSASTAFTTDSCGGGSPAPGGGSSSSSTSWSNTFSITDSQFEKGYSKAVGSKERVKISVEGSTHHVGVKSVTSSSVTVEIASTPVTVTLDIGEDAKVDVDDDRYYDVYVKLNSITSNKADLLIQKIHELVPEEQESAVDTTGEVDEEAQLSPGGEGGGIPGWGIALIVIIILVIIIGGGIVVKKRREV